MIEPCKIETYTGRCCGFFSISYVDILEILYKWDIPPMISYLCGNIPYILRLEMTDSTFFTLTFNFMNEQMHISDCHFN